MRLKSGGGSTGGSNRRSGRQTGGSTKTGFLKKLLPGQWKSRSQNGDAELSNETWEQLGSLPEGMREEAFRRLANQRGKKFRIFYDDTAADDDDGPNASDMRAALERSTRSASSRAASSASASAQMSDPAVRAFFGSGALDYSHRIAPGFYACFGEFPEVADKGELPSLPLLRQCVVLEGREVITVDPNSDQGLRTFLDVKIIEAVTAEGTVETTRRVAVVAALVASRLGGASPDHSLAARYSQYTHSMQLGQQSAVLPLGMLTVGMSRHRAILAKLALARVGITSAIRPAAGDGKALIFQEDASEVLVNLTDRPGELTLLGQGGPPSHASHPTPPASPRVATQPLQDTPSYDARPPAATSLGHLRNGSAPSLAVRVNSGGAASVVRSSGISVATAGTAVAAAEGEAVSAEVAAAGTGESSASWNSGLRTALLQRSGNGSSVGVDSPHAEGGSVPLDQGGRGNTVGGIATPPRSMSPAPTTFINRMPNPFVGSGAPAAVPVAAAPTLVAWPFCQPELLSVAVRLQGHSRAMNTGLGGRRRGDDSGKDRGDLMFLSTGSSGWGGGNGSFFGGEHFPHPTADGPLHPPLNQPSLPVSTTSFAASTSGNHYIPGALSSTGAALADLAPAMAPASFDAYAGVGTARGSEGLPASVSAPMPAAPGAGSGRRLHPDAHFASVFEGHGLAITGHRERPHSGGQVQTSPPTRPPIAPRTSMSPPTGSPRRVTFDQAAEAAFERMSSCGRSIPGSNPAHAAQPDLRPDVAAMQFSGLNSEEMPWFGGSSRLEGSILVSERSRGSSLPGDAPGGSPMSARAATADADADWADTPTSRTGVFPTIPEAPELPPQAAMLATAFGSSGSATDSSFGDECRRGQPHGGAVDMHMGPPVAAGLATAFSDSTMSQHSSSPHGAASPAASPSKAAVLASPFGDSEDEEPAQHGEPVSGTRSMNGTVYHERHCGGTAAALASPFGDDSSDDGAGPWGSCAAGGGTAAALASPFDDDDDGSAGGLALPAPGEQHSTANGVAQRPGAAAWRNEGGARMGVVPSLMSPFGDGGDDDEDVPAFRGRPARVVSRDWETTTEPGGPPSATAAAEPQPSPTASQASLSDAPTVARKAGRASRPPVAQPSRASRSRAHRRTYPFSRQPPSRVDYSSSTDEEIAAELGGGGGGGHASLQAASAGAGWDGPSGTAQASGGAGLTAEMSSAISLDHQSGVLPSAEANLRALVKNKSVHTMEAQFRMWINTSDITMTDEVIGRGSYGQVMLAKFRTERCAVKQIICETKAEYRAAMQEMLLMQELQFDKIVRFFGAIKRGRGVLWMCMEYMPFSDLRKVLHSGGHRRECRFPESMLTLSRRLKWAKDVVAALDLLHSRAVVHRDLKPGNVLISNKGDAVLSDFGLSRVREAQQSRLQASGPGTVSYAAPEALRNNHVSPASDMFSLGCVLWELLSMKEPWAELGGATFQIMSNIVHEQKSLRVEDISLEVREQVPLVIEELRKCFSFDPSKRPTAVHVYEVLDDAIENM
eukprot:jgi/Ulvmu1/11165/UM072_0001.1